MKRQKSSGMEMSRCSRKVGGAWFAASLILAGILPGLTGCKESSVPAPVPQAPQVEVLEVATQTVSDEPEFIGQTEASRPVEIRAQVTGLLKSVLYQEGRDVKKGDPLYQIDPVPFQAAVASAKAKISQANARVIQAKQNLARVKPLLAEQAVSQKDLDDAVAEELASKASLEGARAELIKAEFDLSNTMIMAPISGRIERSRFYEGRLISAQTDLLTVIHQLDPMYVYASAPESFILKRMRERVGQDGQGAGLYDLKATLIFADGTSYQHEGVVDMVEVGLRSETGSRNFRVSFPNKERILLPGQFVKVRIKGNKHSGVTLVPQRAVQQGPTGPVVFLVGSENKVEIRNVQAASWHDSQWIIEEGLKPGDRVIVNGLHRVTPGLSVNPVPVSPEGEPESGQPGSGPLSDHPKDGNPDAVGAKGEAVQ